MSSPRPNRCSSLKRERRMSVNVQLDQVFWAVEKQSLPLLREHLRIGENLINGHGGSFYITPLHTAVQLGWVDGVQELLQQGASVSSRNQFDQTPLHYAVVARHEEITAMLLDHRSSAGAINLHDMRGTSPLHEGAASSNVTIVNLLLESGAMVNTRDKQGESPMHKAAKAGAFSVMVALMQRGADLRKKDYRGVSALRWLMLTNPDGLQRLLDHLLTTSVAGNRRSPVTFDFSALINDPGTQQCQLLSYFVETGNREILSHPMCHVFLLVKWKRARIVFLGYLLYFVVYALLTGLFVFNRLLWNNCNPNNQTEQQHQHTTSAPDFSCNRDEADPLPYLWMKVCLCVQILIILLSQLNRIRIQGIAYIKAPSFIHNIVLVLCVLSLLVSSWHHGPANIAYWEHHVATIVFLLLQLQFLLILRKYPSHGLYVAMFIRVAEDFLRIFLIYCTLLVCFTLTLYLAFNVENHHDPVYKDVQLLFLKSLTMMVGSVDVNDNMVNLLNSLPYTGYLIFLLFILLISIVLANLLIALAVSDIRELRSSAHLMRLASMVDAIISIEQLCDFPLLKHLADYCQLDTRACQVRLWPQHDTRRPSVVVTVREDPVSPHKWPGCIAWLKDRLHRRRYEIHIPASLQEEVLNRISARDYTMDSDLKGNEQDTKTIYSDIMKRLRAIEIAMTR
ncbi:transient receptor potential channel pyrexia-like [Homarus americanus]|uniref:Transient receptor potential channel pyrexia-like 6 n=1 Tax=Homarus americanus TaxID=6706 RepID=A0A8J5JS80_HOMAM|nr:transient receptor potential channel pyrexia-like [Homarus americanus]KAG7160810.1 Transient receptor potential channel pyrexia-like 6 [Homarus americanus]